MNKYYAFITPFAVGIFTQWPEVDAIVTGTKGAHHRSFCTFEAAQDFILSNLPEMDRQDFGLNRNPIYLNKKFVRTKQFFAEKEAKKRG